MILKLQFATPNRHIGRRFKTKSNLLALHFQDGNDNAVADRHALTDLSAQY
jgi:hypothetical protein